MKNKKFITKSIKDMTLTASLIAVLFVQEFALASIPNVQLTVMLLMVYSKELGFRRTSIITFIHVLLDSYLGGGFSIYYTPFMFIGWMFIPLLLRTVFKNIEGIFKLSMLSILFSLLYSWMFIIPSVFIFNLPLGLYIIYDIPWEIALVTSSFISVLYLYRPVRNIIRLVHN